MRPFPIPVTALGAGSRQAQELDVFAMPRADPLRTPPPPESASACDLAAAADVVEQLLEAMARHGTGSSDAPSFSLMAMSSPALAALNDSLGQGEVSAIVKAANGGPAWRVQESAFPGVWRVRREGASGAILADILEAGEVPAVVKEAIARVPLASLERAKLLAGVMNAPAIIEELRHHARRYVPGREAHVINLSLLPLASADHAGLDGFLGVGPVAFLSRGFGNCTVTSTTARSVWRVRYFNSMSTLILDTIEVVDFPEAARAGAEDHQDSAERLRELVCWLRG